MFWSFFPVEKYLVIVYGIWYAVQVNSSPTMREYAVFMDKFAFAIFSGAIPRDCAANDAVLSSSCNSIDVFCCSRSSG